MRLSDVNISILTTFIAVHVITAVLVAQADFQLTYLYWMIVIFCLRWLGFTCAVHRYFSHKVCRTSRWFQFVLAIWGTLTMARSPIRFASGHRHHHMHSDLSRDLHSFHVHGFFMSYVGWVISKKYHEDNLGHVRDLLRYPELVWINRFYFIPNLLLLFGLYLLGGIGLMTYGGLISILLTWHTAFGVTVLFHIVGKRAYETGDESKNSFLLGVLTFGEGWHNNHHANMFSARMGHHWWQLDLGYWVFVLFERLGLIWDVNRSVQPVHILRVPISTHQSTTNLSDSMADAVQISSSHVVAVETRAAS